MTPAAGVVHRVGEEHALPLFRLRLWEDAGQMAVEAALIRRRLFYVIDDDDQEWLFLWFKLKTQCP